MNHAHFKTTHAAAEYVAEGLDEQTQEAFELHLMGCTECLQDVEVWRAIKHEMPRQAASHSPRRLPAGPTWRLAASWVAVGTLGAAGGWTGKSLQSSDVPSAATVVFNLPALTRAADCTPVLLDATTRSAIVRIAQVPVGTQATALDANQHPIATALRTQPDGSQLLRLDSRSLVGADVYLQTRGGNAAEPLGCITGQIH